MPKPSKMTSKELRTYVAKQFDMKAKRLIEIMGPVIAKHIEDVVTPLLDRVEDLERALGDQQTTKNGEHEDRI